MTRGGNRCLCLLLGVFLVGCPTAKVWATNVFFGRDSLKSRVLTVYSDGFAQVEETRKGKLPKGVCHLRVSDVASGIVPESVFLRGEMLSVREMSARAPLTDPHALLMSYIGKTVKAVRQDPRTGEDRSENATLLAVDPGPVLRVGERLEVNYPGRIVLPMTPDGPVVEGAQLDFLLDSEEASLRQLTLQYLLPGLHWQADYAVVYDETKGVLDLRGWVGVNNGGDDSFEDVTLRVVAGNVARVFDRPSAGNTRAEMKTLASVAEMRPPAVSGYRLYPIARKVSVAAGERKQIAFVKRSGVPVTRSYRVIDPVGVFRSAPGSWSRRGALLQLAFKNTSSDAVRLPLPAGVVRVMAVRNNEADLFLGEDRVEHVADGARVAVQLGRVVDVGYEAQRLEFRDISRNSSEQRFNITLYNDGDVPADVEMSQTFPSQWVIFGEDDIYTRRDAQTAVWNTMVPAHGRTNIAFWVRISSGN